MRAAPPGPRVSFNREARERFLVFAGLPEALWSGSFRDFSAAVHALSATLSDGGRVGMAAVEEEVARPARARWTTVRRDAPEVRAGNPRPRGGPSAMTTCSCARVMGDARGREALDRFDRPQLAEVIRVLPRVADALGGGPGTVRALAGGSDERQRLDRLRKYLARLGLSWGRGNNNSQRQISIYKQLEEQSENISNTTEQNRHLNQQQNNLADRCRRTRYEQHNRRLTKPPDLSSPDPARQWFSVLTSYRSPTGSSWCQSSLKATPTG